MSILDQVRKNQFQDSLSGFNPVEVLNTLFSRLSDKEKEVIKRRFGLSENKKHTLEEIGKEYGITRERVRQIENLSIKKLKELEDLRDDIHSAERVVIQVIEQYGGIMEEEFFLENVLNYLDEAENNVENAMLFLAEHIFSDNIQKAKQDKEFNNLWQANGASIITVKDVVSEMTNVITNNKKPIKLDELLKRFKNSDFYKENKDKILSAGVFLEASEEDVDKVLESYLRASRKIKQNFFEEWGLTSWGTIQPKKINDKIYMVMKKVGKPMHFREIAEEINNTKFDEKVAYAPTVHNELILDDKYILIGRGIYALKEWGYQEGNVADVIENLLKENGPLSKDEVIEKVLAQRNVKRSTIYLSLMNNSKIKKVDGNKYVFVLDNDQGQQ